MNHICIGCGSGLFRDSLELFCRLSGRFSSVTTASESSELETALSAGRPTVLLIDPETFVFPRASKREPEEMLLHIRNTYSIVTIIAFWTPDVEPARRPLARTAAALRHKGYDACLLKTTSFTELLQMAYCQNSGAQYVHEQSPAAYRADTPVITKRERETLEHICSGSTSKETAYMMGIRVSTVDTYRKQLMRKFGTHSVAELVRVSLRTGIIPP
jgi:DNA-binding NarL/FixJ family response regulator